MPNLFNDEKHPMSIEVEVLAGKFFNSPEGGNYPEFSRLKRAVVELEPNRSIFRPTDTPKNRELLGADFERYLRGKTSKDVVKDENAKKRASKKTRAKVEDKKTRD